MDFPVVFYDGDCGFCNRSVQFILDHERGGALHFCALQSETARQFFREHRFPEPDLSTFYFWNGKQLYERSSGGLRVAGYLKAPYSWMKIFIVVPKFIRDGVYNWVANRRHKLANQQCALPTPEQRKRFMQ
jgi:predicted DCC family thiol-disulfide oxidoreductase YuxK